MDNYPLALGRGKALTVHKEIHFPHSIGLLYSALTYYTGFKVNSGEYKVMGLAPYGEPRDADLIKDNLIYIKDDGSFQLDMSYFGYCTGLTMTNERFDKLFGGPPRTAPKRKDTMRGAYLGPEYSSAEIKEQLTQAGATFTEYSEPEVIKKTAQALVESKAIDWLNGRMEFGSRALSSKSIIADARSPKMQKLLNLKVKYQRTLPSLCSQCIARTCQCMV